MDMDLSDKVIMDRKRQVMDELKKEIGESGMKMGEAYKLIASSNQLIKTGVESKYIPDDERNV